MRVLLVCLGTFAACSQAPAEHSELTADAEPPMLALAGLDNRAVATDSAAAVAAAATGVPSDASGLLGRNRDWGALYSVRFQLGAGFAVRVAAAVNDGDTAERAFRAIEVGALSANADGSLPTTLPSQYATPSASDVASAAAFFLGDACLGVSALPDGLISAERMTAVTDALGRSVVWLGSQKQLLTAADASAPNRLYYDALAFAACGALSANADVVAMANSLVDSALAQFDDNVGTYIEGGGTDTNYDAVNMVEATDLLIAGSTYRSGDIAGQLQQSLAWITGRTEADGRVDSTGNTRTCGGCEVFLPGDPPKQLGPSSWYRALAWDAALFADTAAQAAATRFVAWVETNPTTSCFAGTPLAVASCPP